MTRRYQLLKSRPSLTLLACVFLSLLAAQASAQIPTLPSGALTSWEVSQPEEIVTWVLFDPSTVKNRIPEDFRFVTVRELAEVGVARARAFQTENPLLSEWGVSFLEVVRSRTFLIDGQGPDMSEHGAAALWFTLIALSKTGVDLDEGEQPILALEVWLPDRDYVAAMREKGHYATYGNVMLRKDSDGKWRGAIQIDDLNVVAECLPAGPIRGGAESSGRQVIIPPRSSGVTEVVRIAYAGHRIQECDGGSLWDLQGNHPIAAGVVFGPAEFQYGYNLQAGAYSP